MNREILFRGQTRKRGEKVNMAGEPIDGHWVYGGIFPGEGDFSIIYSYGPVEKHVVYTDTVGQYTGLTDKNGVKIFEGDICRVGNLTYQVVFQYSQWWFSIVDPSVYCCPYFHSHCEEHCEVIGNIHDNPELIGGEDDG